MFFKVYLERVLPMSHNFELLHLILPFLLLLEHLDLPSLNTQENLCIKIL